VMQRRITPAGSYSFFYYVWLSCSAFNCTCGFCLCGQIEFLERKDCNVAREGGREGKGGREREGASECEKETGREGGRGVGREGGRKGWREEGCVTRTDRYLVQTLSMSTDKENRRHACG
jgi:hypothetical protein